ncbi:MAG TPA: MlrC C-terminal domain-containing protein [bacterium]|nr:MlrC C-terminal domain-containing protein [bacterium]
MSRPRSWRSPPRSSPIKRIPTSTRRRAVFAPPGSWPRPCAVLRSLSRHWSSPPCCTISCCLHQLTSCGVYPERQRILAVKGAVAPRAAYEPMAARIIEVDTDGATAVNPARLTYTRVRRPLFGLDE